MAVATVKFALTNAWTDLGAGPMLVGFNGGGTFAISDASPAIPVSEGFAVIAGESFRVETTSHVWASARSNLGATVYVAAY